MNRLCKLSAKNVELYKKLIMRLMLILLFLFTKLQFSFSQEPIANNDQTVVITVIGQGKNIEEAKSNALRSAIEQAFGTFISSNTIILNDSIIKDEIVSLSSGNINKFEITGSERLPKGDFMISLKATVSIGKLINFCESKGIKVEFQGSLFSANIRQKKLAEQSEIKAVWDLLFTLNPIINNSFDYKIKANEPIALNHDQNQYQVKLFVDCYTNSNIEVVFNSVKGFLKSASLSKDEVENLKKLNIGIQRIKIDGLEYFIRTEESINALNKFFNDIKLIENRFVIDDGIKQYDNLSVINIVETLGLVPGDKEWRESNSYYDQKNTSLNYSGFENISEYSDLSSGIRCAPGLYQSTPSYNSGCHELTLISRKSNEKIKTFIINNNYSLQNLEKIQEIRVFPLSKISNVGFWKKGGVVFHENSKYLFLTPIFNQDIALQSQDLCGLSFDEDSRYVSKINTFTTDTSIGSGKKNTMLLFKTLDNINTPFKYANQLSILGYKDWFIPSFSEMKILQFFIQYFLLDKSSYEREYFTSSILPKKYSRLSSHEFIAVKNSEYGRSSVVLCSSDIYTSVKVVRMEEK